MLYVYQNVLEMARSQIHVQRYTKEMNWHWIESKYLLVFGSFMAAVLMATQASALECKILLPKFNTWKQVLLERKNGLGLPLGNTVSGFSSKKFWLYAVIASPLRRKGDVSTA